LDVPASIPSIDISGEARRNIYLTVKEVLHNIIKHSGADKIQVTVTCNDKLSIRISDNGKGFSAGAVGKMGNGLKNMQQRMEKLNGRFIVQNNLGTTITLEIPLKKNL
jgi:signal transduction histidine kinase